MNDLQNKLCSRIFESKSSLDYQVLFKWINDINCNDIMLQKEFNKSQAVLKYIYYDLQAFHFALSAKNIETITLDWIIYPAWGRLLCPYLKDWSEFNSERLDYISCEEHSNTIFRSFEKMQSKFGLNKNKERESISIENSIEQKEIKEVDLQKNKEVEERLVEPHKKNVHIPVGSSEQNPSGITNLVTSISMLPRKAMQLQQILRGGFMGRGHLRAAALYMDDYSIKYLKLENKTKRNIKKFFGQ